MAGEFRSQCPIVDRTQETFVDFVYVGGERQRVEFTKPINWLQESESRIQYLHGGKLLKECSTYNDYYGYLTSIDPEPAIELCNHYGITPESTLELVILTTVFQKPATETPDTIERNRSQPANYKTIHAYVPDSWRKESEEDGHKIFPILGNRTLHEGVVWSSKNTPEQNEKLITEFKAKWAVPQQDGGK